MEIIDRQNAIVTQLTTDGMTAGIDWENMPQLPCVMVDAIKSVPKTSDALAVYEWYHHIIVTCVVPMSDLSSAQTAALALVATAKISVQKLPVSTKITDQVYGKTIVGGNAAYMIAIEYQIVDSAD